MEFCISYDSAILEYVAVFYKPNSISLDKTSEVWIEWHATNFASIDRKT